MSAGDAHARPFADFLRELNRGRTHDELSEALRDLVAAVQDTGRGGALTLTIKVSQEKNTTMIKMADEVTSKLPKLDRPNSMWFVDGNGNPCRTDPNQLQFDSLREVPAAAPHTPNPAQEA